MGLGSPDSGLEDLPQLRLSEITALIREVVRENRTEVINLRSAKGERGAVGRMNEAMSEFESIWDTCAEDIKSGVANSAYNREAICDSLIQVLTRFRAEQGPDRRPLETSITLGFSTRKTPKEELIGRYFAEGVATAFNIHQTLKEYTEGETEEDQFEFALSLSTQKREFAAQAHEWIPEVINLDHQSAKKKIEALYNRDTPRIGCPVFWAQGIPDIWKALETSYNKMNN